MSAILFFISTIVLFFSATYLLEKFIWAPKRRREAEEAPRITISEAQSFWNAIDEDAVPIAKANVQDRDPDSPQESRIGGSPLAIGHDRAWPRSAYSSFPMAFIAQINFEELPEIDDFPNRGILQIFTSFEMTDENGRCEHVIRWESDPKTADLLEIPDGIMKTTRQTRDISERARRKGLPLIFKADTAVGNPYNWPHEENDLCYQNRLPENAEVAKILENWENKCDQIVEGYGVHWVGGHPSFVQYDVRGEHAELSNLNRVIFHLGCDDDINIGDAGELNVLINKEDLLNQNFKKAYLTWDCT